MNRYMVSMGMYMVSRRLVANIPPGPQVWIRRSDARPARRGDASGRVPFEGYWLDIGRPDDYMRAIEDFETGRKRFLTA